MIIYRGMIQSIVIKLDLNKEWLQNPKKNVLNIISNYTIHKEK